LCSIPTSINSIAVSESISYAPNPFADKVKLSFQSNDKKNINVYTIDGKLIYSDTFYNANYELNADKFIIDTKGLIFVKVQSNQGISVIKLIRVQ